jgi:hypothetical protein
VQLDLPRVADRQWRGIDDGLITLDLIPHVVEGMMRDVSRDENYYFQPYPVCLKIQPSLDRVTPFEAFLCEHADSCALECGVWAVMEVQCNLKCDLNQRPMDQNRDPGALLICDLVTSVGFAVVAAATERDDDPVELELAEHFVVLFPLKYRKCGADND